MKLILVHHGEAVGPGVDPMRPLTARGREAVEALAQAAASRGLKPAAVRHSGKLRARQTAEAYWRACNPLAPFEAARGLQPDDPPAWIRDDLAGETDDLMLVSHMPFLPRLLRLLVGGTEDAAGIDFPLNGFVVLERTETGWHEVDRGG